MNTKKFLGIVFSLLLFSNCKEDEELTTFERIEKEFGLKKKFPALTRKNILNKYGNLDYYRRILKQQIALITNSKRNDASKILKTCKVRLVSQIMGMDVTFDCDDDTNILDAAELAGIDLPSSCRAGACSTCVGKLVIGMCTQSFLCDKQLEQGWIPLCVSTPNSDCVITPWMEENLPDICNPTPPIG